MSYSHKIISSDGSNFLSPILMDGEYQLQVDFFGSEPSNEYSREENCFLKELVEMLIHKRFKTGEVSNKLVQDGVSILTSINGDEAFHLALWWKMNKMRQEECTCNTSMDDIIYGINARLLLKIIAHKTDSHYLLIRAELLRNLGLFNESLKILNSNEADFYPEWLRGIRMRCLRLEANTFFFNMQLFKEFSYFQLC